MKLFSILLMLRAAAYIAHGFPCEEGESPDFRFSDWGDSPAKVIANEELDLDKVNPAFLSDQTLETWAVIPDDGSRPELKSLIGNAPISVSYRFRDGRLFKEVYFLALENIRAGNQRRLCSLVRKRLTEKIRPANQGTGQYAEVLDGMGFGADHSEDEHKPSLRDQCGFRYFRESGAGRNCLGTQAPGGRGPLSCHPPTT